jgi:hypothetical protein
VLIKASNLDKPLSDGSINLTNAGLQRSRVLWIREMTSDEIQRAGDTAPTIDAIEVAQFESHAALKEWPSQKAPGFLTYESDFVCRIMAAHIHPCIAICRHNWQPSACLRFALLIGSKRQHAD